MYGHVGDGGSSTTLSSSDISVAEGSPKDTLEDQDQTPLEKKCPEERNTLYARCERKGIIFGSSCKSLPRLNANETQTSYDMHHKVSSLVESHQNTHNSYKYEVLIKQYLRSILDIRDFLWSFRQLLFLHILDIFHFVPVTPAGPLPEKGKARHLFQSCFFGVVVFEGGK